MIYNLIKDGDFIVQQFIWSNWILINAHLEFVCIYPVQNNIHMIYSLHKGKYFKSVIFLFASGFQF